MRRSCFPAEARIDTGRLLLGRVRCHPFPDVVARMQPSDSLVAVDLGSLRSPSAYLDAAKELRGSPRLLGRPLADVPWSKTPPSAPPPRPMPVTSPRSSRNGNLSTPRGDFPFRSYVTHGPPLRAPTHRRVGYPPRRKARYRPAGLGSDRVDFASTGRRTEFQSFIACFSFRTSVAWSHSTWKHRPDTARAFILTPCTHWRSVP
jgi:hypothetical protein